MTELADKIRARRKRLALAYDFIAKEEASIEADCPHETLTYKYQGDTGNWCKADDSYWIDWKCDDCDKRWQTTQDDSWCLTKVVYPHAKEIK